MSRPSWTAEELCAILASGNSVTDVAERLHDIEIDELNAQLRKDAEERHRKWLPDFEARVARHERISAEDTENYGTLPAGYARAEHWNEFFTWCGEAT